MFASALISNVLPPLRTSDTVQKALDRMAEFKVLHLPIVSDSQFLALVSEEELIAQKDPEIAIGAISLTLINPFVFENSHIYDVIRLISQLGLSLVPVLDQHKAYLGVVSQAGILAYVADLFAVKDPGGIIVLAISNRNISLAHLAQIVEADNAQILSSYVNTFPDSTRIEVTLKVNKTELGSLIATFERYNYEVKAFFNNTHNDDGLAERFNSFMNYLNV